MVNLHKKNLLSLANKSIRETKNFKDELAKAAFIALILGGSCAILINNNAIRENLYLYPDWQNYKYLGPS